jgi:hypothetical protein
MPGYLLDSASKVLCAHAGNGLASVTNPRVKLSGQPSIVQSNSYSVSGCSFTIGTTPSPCVTAQWTVVATRIKSGGQAFVLEDSQAVCAPNGTPATLVVAQRRVKGM